MELVEQSSDAGTDGFGSALGCVAQQVFQLGEDLLDGIKIGTVRRQEQEPGPDAPDRLRTAFPLWLPRLSMITTSPGFSVGRRKRFT